MFSRDESMSVQTLTDTVPSAREESLEVALPNLRPQVQPFNQQSYKTFFFIELQAIKANRDPASILLSVLVPLSGAPYPSGFSAGSVQTLIEHGMSLECRGRDQLAETTRGHTRTAQLSQPGLDAEYTLMAGQQTNSLNRTLPRSPFPAHLPIAGASGIDPSFVRVADNLGAIRKRRWTVRSRGLPNGGPSKEPHRLLICLRYSGLARFIAGKQYYAAAQVAAAVTAGDHVRKHRPGRRFSWHGSSGRSSKKP